MTDITTINIIGAGKVGRTLAKLIAEAPKYELAHVYSRSFDSAKTIDASRAVPALADIGPADIWFLTVPDDQIGETATRIAHHNAAPSVAVHFSGFYPSTALAPLANWATASCHPVRSFADPNVSAQGFAGTYCGIEGDDTAAQLMTAFVTAIGGQPFPISTKDKAIYHAAAVFSNNFAVTLQAIALEAWAKAGVPADIAKNLCDGLLNNAAQNVANTDPQTALTGPAARGDTTVIREQHAAIDKWDPEIATIYQQLSDAAQRLKQTGQITKTPAP